MKSLTMSELHEIEVRENDEPLVEIEESERLQLLKEHRYLVPLLRVTVRDMLYRASDNLPEGYKLLVITAHRPRWMQEELWRQRVRQMTKRHLFIRIFRLKEFKRRVGLYTAPPGGSSHQCGAAVDVTIVAPDGARLDMGSHLTDYGARCHTENDLITTEQQRNRKLLLDTMTKAGFVNYPFEWWHYSYGDRHWAVYTGRKVCFYGFIEDGQLRNNS